MEASSGRHKTRRPCDWPPCTSVACTGAGDTVKKKKEPCSSFPLVYSSRGADAAAAGSEYNNNRERCEERGCIFGLFTQRDSASETLVWLKAAFGSAWIVPPVLLLPIGRRLPLPGIHLLVNRVASARTPSGALMHPFQWCNGERSFSASAEPSRWWQPAQRGRGTRL